MKAKYTTKKSDGPYSTVTKRTATVRSGLGRSVVKLKRTTENYGTQGFTGATTTGYKKVYKSGTLKKLKKY